MEIKGIDASSVQGKPNWEKATKSGVRFAILRAHQKFGIDASFEHNYKGCKDNGILVGAYKYSYALTVRQAVEEAEAVLGVLNGRGLDFPVFYDLEWSEQRKLGKAAITKIARAFLDRIEEAGYIPAIYCNVDWHKNVLDVSSLPFDYWLAAYPANDTGAIQEHLRPSAGVGWQYSSKGKVPGISGHVDMNVFYTDYAQKKEAGKMNQAKLIMDKAASFIGTVESPPGSNNVIFNTDYYGGAVSGDWYPWCCAFVWDIFRMCGLSGLFYDGKKTAYCPTVYNWARQKGLIVPKETARYGDIVLFDWGGDGVADHIGLVEDYNGANYATVEGNTSVSNNSNGGQVMRRTRYAGQIQAIVRPKYSGSAAGPVNQEFWKAIGTATSAVDNLYVRAEPNGVVLGELMKGNRFETDGKTSGNWTHVKVANIGIGYVCTQYIKHDGQPGDAMGKPTTEISNKQDRFRRLFVGKVTADILNVRTWAGTGYPCINSYPQLSYGNLVDVMDFTQKDEHRDKWYYVRIAGMYHGFAHGAYIEKA